MPLSAVALAAVVAVRAAAAPAAVAVCHDGFLILRIRTAAWGMPAPQRAVIIQQRFTNLISAALQAQAAEKPVPRPAAARSNGDWVVMARGSVLVTVTALDAAANHTTPGPLAKIWAERFGAALMLATFGGRGPCEWAKSGRWWRSVCGWCLWLKARQREAMPHCRPCPATRSGPRPARMRPRSRGHVCPCRNMCRMRRGR